MKTDDGNGRRLWQWRPGTATGDGVMAMADSGRQKNLQNISMVIQGQATAIGQSDDDVGQSQRGMMTGDGNG